MAGDIPVLDLSSSAPLPGAIAQAAGPTIGRPDAVAQAASRAIGSIWLNGDVLLCVCPDCRAPMSVRLWLMIADCWRCGTSIELSEEQEREARRLLERREMAQRTAAPATTAAAPTQQLRSTPSVPRRTPLTGPTPPDPPARSTKTAPRGAPSTNGESVRRKRRPASANPVGVRARIRKMSRLGAARLWLGQLLKDMPAWLVSGVFHLVLLMLLALLNREPEPEDRTITISTSVGRHAVGGEDDAEFDPFNDVTFDLPLPDEREIQREEQKRALILADQDAREIRLEPDANVPELPELSHVKRMIGSSDATERTLAVRDPRVRVEMVKREGGTTLTEAAVSRGLRWMSQYQNANGSWSLHAFNGAPGAPGNSSAAGSIRSDSAGTSLVLLPFLGAGQSHLSGRYKDAVSKGLRWLIDNQGLDGSLIIDSQGNSGMYAHGQGAIVLCEAFALSQDESLRAPAQKAVDFIVNAQHIGGGWRYRPKEAGDTSVLGWQLMALQSARMADLNVPDATLEMAGHYLDTVQSRGPDGELLYAYQRGRQPTHVMTAEALLCRMYLGWTNDSPGVRQSIDYLADQHLPGESGENASIYYWYYATQAMHHVGGRQWDRWNMRMRDVLVRTQRKSGPEAGSWDPVGQHAGTGGRLYMTALGTCTLEVYYRHAPIFRRIKLD